MGLGGFLGSADNEVFGWCFFGKGSVGSVAVIEVWEGLEHAIDNPN
jgi:hypothetical protein